LVRRQDRYNYGSVIPRRFTVAVRILAVVFNPARVTVSNPLGRARVRRIAALLL
jgi:hypothetical protein